MRRDIIVLGLGFGDEGKGSIVDALVRRTGASGVVRYNGGPQAAHHVVTPEGSLHCFSQCGAGSFVEGVDSYLTAPMFVDPLALVKEAEALERVGVRDALERVQIDSRCLVVTPFHKLLNRIQELARGDGRHGSCGKGVGQTFMDSLKPGYPVITMADLYTPKRLLDKLRFLWLLKRDVAEQIAAERPEHPQLQEAKQALESPELVHQVYSLYGRFVQSSGARLASSEQLYQQWCEAPGPLVWEGAQGVLLDAERGFWPHVTPSRTTLENTRALRSAAQAVGYRSRAQTIGVLRAYSSRHGAGPFVSESPWLTERLPELHNDHNPWQGGFRVGCFDLLMARYALRVSPGVQGLALTQLDRLCGLPELQLCTGYTFQGPVDSSLSRYFICENDAIRDIRVPSVATREYQTELTRMLQWCKPLLCSFEGWNRAELRGFLKGEQAPRIEAYLSALELSLGLPIQIVSAGPRATDKLFLGELAGKTALCAA